MSDRSQPASQPVNEALRRWTRGVSFTLAMGKQQVATLVSCHLSQDRPYPPVGHRHRLVSAFVGAMKGLEERGLVKPHIWIAGRTGDDKTMRALINVPFGRMYEVTEAGELVVRLLKLSGIYDELRAELESDDAARRMRIA